MYICIKGLFYKIYRGNLGWDIFLSFEQVVSTNIVFIDFIISISCINIYFLCITDHANQDTSPTMNNRTLLAGNDIDFDKQKILSKIIYAFSIVE